MKIWHQMTGNINKDQMSKYKDGDIEVFDDGDCWLVLEGSHRDYDNKGPEFGGCVGASEYCPEMCFENIEEHVKVVKRTKIAEKVHVKNIWKENKEWLVIKK